MKDKCEVGLSVHPCRGGMRSHARNSATVAEVGVSPQVIAGGGTQKINQPTQSWVHVATMKSTAKPELLWRGSSHQRISGTFTRLAKLRVSITSYEAIASWTQLQHLQLSCGQAWRSFFQDHVHIECVQLQPRRTSNTTTTREEEKEEEEGEGEGGGEEEEKRKKQDRKVELIACRSR